jgi:hypothetical protein
MSGLAGWVGWFGWVGLVGLGWAGWLAGLAGWCGWVGLGWAGLAAGPSVAGLAGLAGLSGLAGAGWLKGKKVIKETLPMPTNHYRKVWDIKCTGNFGRKCFFQGPGPSKMIRKIRKSLSGKPLS